MGTISILRYFLFTMYLCQDMDHVQSYDTKDAIVNTSVGIFIGYVYRTDYFGEELSSRRFLGIPYAEPPVGDLRFKKPIRKENLKHPYSAKKLGPACMQQMIPLGGHRKPGLVEGFSASEDCLYLNIYTPNKLYGANEKLPVMIYFHGGGFVVGSPAIYPGDVVASYGDVIWVTVAYRLSIWGFLSTGDDNLPGNYGLWDQHMAIQWVHEHIDNFDGDPEAITLIGSSAGGASTIYQSMFPGNMGLVKRAIPQSGSITNPWAFNPDPLMATKRLAKCAGCDIQQPTNNLAVCLRSKSSNDLGHCLNKNENAFVRFPMEFTPTVDHDFLPESPMELFMGQSETAVQYKAALSNVDMLTGVVSGEGLMMLNSFVGVDDTQNFKADRKKFEHELVPEVLRIVFGETYPEILQSLVINEYTKWDDPDNCFNSRESYIDLSSEYVFNIQAIQTAQLHSKLSKGSTYVYLYDAFLSRRILEVPEWTSKAQHVDDMTTLLGYDGKDGYLQWLTPYTENPPEQWELELSKAHITMWSNFAKSGDPNEPRDLRPFINTIWPKYNMASQCYLNIARQMSESSVKQRLFARASNFWYHVLPSVIEAVKAGTSEEENGFCEKDGGCDP